MPTSKKGRDLSRLGLVGSPAAGAAWQGLVSSAELPGERLEGARDLPIALIEPFADQPRKRFDQARLQALADSIREDGLIQPIAVRPHPEQEGRYLIVAGERRWRATQMAGLDSIPAVIVEDDDVTAARKMLRENVEREDLDIEDLGLYLQTLAEAGATQRDLAALTHFSLGKVNGLLKLVKYPDLLEMIRNGFLSQEQAIELAKQPELLDQVRRGPLTLAQALELLKYPDLLEQIRSGRLSYRQALEQLDGWVLPRQNPARTALAERRSARNPYRAMEDFAAWTARFKPAAVPAEDRPGLRLYVDQMIGQLTTLRDALGDEPAAQEEEIPPAQERRRSGGRR